MLQYSTWKGKLTVDTILTRMDYQDCSQNQLLIHSKLDLFSQESLKFPEQDLFLKERTIKLLNAGHSASAESAELYMTCIHSHVLKTK